MMLTASMVRMIKGAAASIILLLMTEPRGGNQEWLERYTGYTDKPVSAALSFLFENGMIVKTGDRGEYSYRLAGETMQLPLSLDQLGDGSQGDSIPDHNYPVDVLEITPIPEIKEIESEKYSDSPSLASGFNQNLESGIKPPPPGINAESENFRLNLAAIDQIGIREPARTRLARLKNITPRMIHYHCGTAGHLGRAIYRIEHGWTVPADWEPMDFAAGELQPSQPEPDPSRLEGVPEQIRIEWDAALAEAAGRLNRAEFSTWASCITLLGLDSGELVIGAGNPYAVTWLGQHLRPLLVDRLAFPVRFEVRHESPG